jgi:hypothetical protein
MELAVMLVIMDGENQWLEQYSYMMKMDMGATLKKSNII